MLETRAGGEASPSQRPGRFPQRAPAGSLIAVIAVGIVLSPWLGCGPSGSQHWPSWRSWRQRQRIIVVRAWTGGAIGGAGSSAKPPARTCSSRTRRCLPIWRSWRTRGRS
jgi:hypothetical protein